MLAAARQAVPRPGQRRALVAAVTANPDLLRGRAAEAPVQAVLRLIELLTDAGVAGMVRAACPRGGPVVALVNYANVMDDSLVDWADQELGVRLEVVKRSDDVKGFQILPRRWVVERSLGWLTRCRRLCRDYERTIAHAEDFVKVAMIRLMAARLTGQQTHYRNIRPAAA